MIQFFFLSLYNEHFHELQTDNFSNVNTKSTHNREHFRFGQKYCKQFMNTTNSNTQIIGEHSSKPFVCLHKQ